MHFTRWNLGNACLLGLVFLLPWALPATAAEPEEDALAADRAFIAAMGRADPSAADKLMDAEFTWTDRTGKTRSKTEVLPALARLAANPDTEVQTIDGRQILLVRGRHQISSDNTSVRFIRAWVRRPAGWQLLVYQETTKSDKNPEKRSGFGAPSGGAPVDCNNPCKTIPYEPAGAAEQEVARMWQDVEKTVLTNDVEAWIPNFTDDFIFVTPDGGDPLNKADRVAMIKELRRTNTTLIPAEVISMKIWVLGDSALMRSEHKPLHGKVLHVTRLFVKRGGHWQIAFGQQTAVE